MALNSALSANLANDAIRVFVAVQIELPTYTIRLIEGDGVVAFSVDGVTRTFDGCDPIYGSLSALGSISEAIATSAPTLELSLLPPTEAAVGELAQEEVQGSRVRVWFGNVSDASGLVVGVPEQMWEGYADTPVVSENEQTRVVDFTIATSWERLFAAQEAWRLNAVWHQGYHPGDTFLTWNSQVQMTQPWGLASPTSTAGTQPNSGGGGYRPTTPTTPGGFGPLVR